MKEKITVPTLGESVSSGIIAAWLKSDGEAVNEGDELFELETDKATLAVPSTASGFLSCLVEEGEEVAVGQVVAEVDTSGGGAAAAGTKRADSATGGPAGPAGKTLEKLSPAVRRIVVEHNLDPASIKGSGKDGRITKADAMAALSTVLDNTAALPDAQSADGAVSGTRGGAADSTGTTVPAGQAARAAASDSVARATGATPGGPAAPGDPVTPGRPAGPAAWQHREKMTSLRKRIAQNLVASKQASAHLTTFNEIDMSAVMALRSEYRDSFEEKHGVRLGFMCFFVKATVEALSEFPVANAMIDGDEIIYNDRYNIGVAVSTDRGLIVPVVKDADGKSFAQIEAEIASFAAGARDRRISPDDLSGGTFSITNGGIFGSLLSTPIPTPPQSAILGMHAIQRRPVAAGEDIVIRPMMYVALTYDHRIMDGKDAVSFLVRIKELIQDPRRLLLGL